MFSAPFRKRDASALMSITDERGPVTYRTEDHLAILCQMYGSVWCKVLPYCVINTILVLLIKYAKSTYGIDLTFNDQGHMFMSTMVSVLIVARSRIAYSRYMMARELLSQITKSCRELIQYLVTFTRYEVHPMAQEWRAEVSSRTVSMLQTIVAVLQSDKRELHEWQSSQFMHRDEWHADTSTRSYDGTFERNPMAMAIFLRTAIASHVEYLSRPLDVNHELRLLLCTSDFVSAYHGLVKLITTPFPFPLVQMTRTALFVWVFSLPFALMSNREGIFAYLLIFFVTYGFIGLEFVSIELDDPFGTDANDINAAELANVVLEDMFICIHDIDGKSAAMSLRKRFGPNFENITLLSNRLLSSPEPETSDITLLVDSNGTENASDWRAATSMGENYDTFHVGNHNEEGGVLMTTLYKDENINPQYWPSLPVPTKQRSDGITKSHGTMRGHSANSGGSQPFGGHYSHPPPRQHQRRRKEGKSKKGTPFGESKGIKDEMTMTEAEHFGESNRDQKTCDDEFPQLLTEDTQDHFLGLGVLPDDDRTESDVAETSLFDDVSSSVPFLHR